MGKCECGRLKGYPCWPLRPNTINVTMPDHIMVSGIPFIKKWSENEPFMRPRYYLDSSSIVKRARDTDIAVASAILDYQRKHADDFAKSRNSISYIRLSRALTSPILVQWISS